MIELSIERQSRLIDEGVAVGHHARMLRIDDVTTSDGAALACWRAGEGPPVVLVHGGGIDHRCFDPVIERLAARYTVFAYNRRGFAPSTDAGSYSLAREVDDLVELAAVVGGGERVAVVGYSYGGLTALQAITTRTAPFRAVLAYEPPLGVPGMIPKSAEICALIDEGRYEEALRLFIASTFLLPDKVIVRMAQHPLWQEFVGFAPKLRRENDEVVASTLQAATGPVPPTRILVAAAGGSPAFHEVAALATRQIPGADIATVVGVPHFAVSSDPAAFVARVFEFCDR